MALTVYLITLSFDPDRGNKEWDEEEEGKKRTKTTRRMTMSRKAKGKKQRKLFVRFGKPKCETVTRPQRG
jgi:hypothetical protein